jgi:hypothetical protein
MFSNIREIINMLKSFCMEYGFNGFVSFIFIPKGLDESFWCNELM